MTHTPIEQEVWQAVEAFNRAFAANDAEAFFALVDDDITVMTPGNPYRVEGRADDREGFEFGLRQGYSRVHFFQELQPKVQVFGEVAVVTYFTRGSYGPETSPKTVYLKETDVLVKRADGWKVVHLHLSATV